MSVDFQTFLNWAQSKFSNVKVHGDEIKVNSIFVDDTKNHLWCNPSGGKRLYKHGVYHCWKSEKKGTLVGLVMQVEPCEKSKAMQILGLEEKAILAPDDIDFDMSAGNPASQLDYAEESFVELHLPPHCFPISQAPIGWHNRAIQYLNQRKLQSDGLYVCTAGKYEGRIIIPYYSRSGKLIYFNGRTITGNNLRYRGPEKEIGVGKEDVVYFTNYPAKGEKVYLCEGEFDALTLHSVGLNAAACGGKNLSEKQAILLSDYKICLALDADEAGRTATNFMLNKITQFGNGALVTQIAAPKEIKDWNNFYCQFDARLLLAYIEKNERKLEVEI